MCFFLLTLSLILPSVAIAEDRELRYFRNLQSRLRDDLNPLAEVGEDRQLSDALMTCLILYQSRDVDAVYRHQAKEIAQLVARGADKSLLIEYFSLVNAYGVESFCPNFSDRISRPD